MSIVTPISVLLASVVIGVLVSRAILQGAKAIAAAVEESLGGYFGRADAEYVDLNAILEERHQQEWGDSDAIVGDDWELV